MTDQSHQTMKNRSPDKRIQRYFVWYSKMLKGTPEDQLLRQLKEGELGEFGSSAALYQQLANDGFPVCIKCGETPVDPDHCVKPSGRRRRAKADAGSLVRLPPAVAARDLFLDALEGLKDYVDALGFQEDWLRGSKRFITHWVDRDVYRIVHGTEYSEAEWEELCEVQGSNPEETDTLELRTMGSSPSGLNRSPSEQLATLIAAYMLSPDGLRRRPFEPLLEALHPNAAAADRRQLQQKVEDLEKMTRHLATVVRGGTLGGGAPIVEVSSEEHFLAWDIKELDPEGASSDEEILRRLRDRWRESMELLTAEDVRRLRSLNLPLPD
jgi:hypothetical protein